MASLVTSPLAPGVEAAPLVIADWHFERSHVELLTGDEDQALHQAALAATVASRWSRSWQAAACAQLALDQPVHAAIAARRSVRQDPDHWAVYVWAAEAADARGESDAAIGARIQARDRDLLEPDLRLVNTGR